MIDINQSAFNDDFKVNYNFIYQCVSECMFVGCFVNRVFESQRNHLLIIALIEC